MTTIPRTAQIPPLTNAQRAVLEVMSFQMEDWQLESLRKLLLEFKHQLLQEMLDEEWEKRGYSDETVQNWLHEHMRVSVRRPERTDSVA